MRPQVIAAHAPRGCAGKIGNPPRGCGKNFIPRAKAKHCSRECRRKGYLDAWKPSQTVVIST
jgi:hypothetical protein